MSDRIRVAIVGGGIAGIILALELLKYPHIELLIYEAANEFSEYGGAIVIGPNAQRAMTLIDPEIKAGYDRICVYNNDDSPYPNGSWPWMNLVQGYGEGAGKLCAAPTHSVRMGVCSRVDLLNNLVSMLPKEKCLFNKKMVAIEEGDGPIALKFADETTATADVVLGADGIHSRIRRHILGENHPAANATFTGCVIHRSLVPGDEADKALGAVANRGGMFSGPDSMIVAAKIAGGQQYYISISDLVAGNHEIGKQDSWTGFENMRGRFRDWHQDPKNIVALAERYFQKSWPIWDMPPAPAYYRSHIAILGDAAHAMPPYQGAGAGQGIEDALVLGHVLGCAKGVADVPAALEAYDTVRRYRSQKVVFTTREFGEIAGHRHPEILGDPAKIKKNVESRFHWIWDCDQTEQLQDAETLMRSILNLKNAGSTASL